MEKVAMFRGPEQVEVFAMLQTKHALKLEKIGLRRKGPSALTVAKKRYGFKGRDFDKAIAHMQALLDEARPDLAQK